MGRRWWPMGRRAGSGGTTCGWSSRRRPSRMDSGVPPVAATACSRVGLVYVGCVRVCARVRARVRACVWACVCGMLRAGLRVWIMWGLGVCAIPRCTDSKVRIVKGARRALAARVVAAEQRANEFGFAATVPQRLRCLCPLDYTTLYGRAECGGIASGGKAPPSLTTHMPHSACRDDDMSMTRCNMTRCNMTRCNTRCNMTRCNTRCNMTRCNAASHSMRRTCSREAERAGRADGRAEGER